MEKINVRLVFAYAALQLYIFMCFGFLNIYGGGTGVTESGISVGNLFSWGSTIVNIIALLACALMRNKVAHSVDSLRALIIAGVLCSCGTMLSGLVGYGDPLFGLVLMLSSLFTGVGTALIYLQFISRFIALGPQDAILNVLVAYGLTFCLMSVSGFITGVFGLVLVSLLPFVPVLLLSHDPASGLSINDGKTMTKEEKAEIKPLVIKLLLAVAVFGIFMGAMKGLFTGARGGWTSMMSLVMVASTLLTAGLIVLSGKLSRRLDAVVVYRCVFFVAVVCVAGLTIDAAHSREMYVVSRVCGELFRCLIVVFSLRLCQRTSFHPLMVAGSLLALAKIASLASGIVVNAIPDSFGAITQGMGLLVVLAFLYLYLFTETDVDALMETSHVTSTREANKQRCEALAARAGLSGREAEVLELYSQGKTVAVIAETLHLSENTVSMYRRKIYAKLDIHSKQELLELLEKEEQ